MAWIKNDALHYTGRATTFNNNICMSKFELNKLPKYFDGIFGNFSDFSSEIASIHMYPFNILPLFNASGVNLLSTSKGVFELVTAYKVDPKNNYLTLGEMYITRKFNNFADYKGYTQVRVFLPMVGYVELDVNECMAKWLQFRLTVDFFTGKGMYIIGVTDNRVTIANPPYVAYGEDSELRILSTYECDIGIEVPVGKSNVSDMKRNLLLGTAKIMATMAGQYYAMALPNPTTNTYKVKNYDIKSQQRGYITPLRTKYGTETTDTTTVHNQPVNKAKPIVDAFDSSLDVLNRNYSGSGTDRVNDSGLLWQASNTVQVVIYRPRLIEEREDFAKLYGYPLGEVRRLGDLTGYTEVSAIHIEGDGFETITQDEIGELENALASGIIL